MWQPIETAPKDGQIIDLWIIDDYRLTDCHWGMETRNGFNDPIKGPGWVRTETDVSNYEHFALIAGIPTHWMPVPFAPGKSCQNQ